MEETRIIADVEGLGEIVQFNTDFFTGLKKLKEANARLVTPRDEAYLRIQTKGREDIGRSEGTWTAAEFEYMKGENSLLTRKSRLLNPNLAQKAVEANRRGQYFSTESAREYEESFKIAQSDKDKAPEKRRVIVLPSRDNFTISPNQSDGVLEFLLGDQTKDYYELNGNVPMQVYLVDKQTVDKQEGTLLTQLWFRNLDDGSGLIGDSTSLGGNRLRGVRYAEGVAQNIKMPYNDREVQKYFDIVQSVREGKIPNSKLGMVEEFLDRLKNR